MELLLQAPRWVLAVVTLALCVSLWLAWRLSAARRETRALQTALRAAELELARADAAREERERAFMALKDELDASRERLKHEFESLAARVLQEREQHFRSSSQHAMTLLLQPFREQLEAFQQRVNQVHDESLRGHAV